MNRSRIGAVVGLAALLVLCSSLAAAKEDAQGTILRLCRTYLEDTVGGGDELLEQFGKERLDSIRAFGDSGVKTLLRLAKDRSKPERTCAWDFLVKLKDDRIVAILRSVIVDRGDTAEAKGLAAGFLGRLNDVGSLDAIVRLLDTDDDETWASAVKALAQLKDDRVRGILHDVMRTSLAKDANEKPWRRGALLAAIGLQRDETMVPLVIEDLKRSEPTDKNRYYACETLARIGTQVSLTAMVEVFKGIRDSHRRATFARFANDELTKLKAELKDPDEVAFFDGVIAELKPFAEPRSSQPDMKP